MLIWKNFKIWNIQIQGLFKNFQEPTLFWKTFKNLKFFFQNSRTFKAFLRTLWTLYLKKSLHYTVKYSKQIYVLFINKLYKNIKNTAAKVEKNAPRKKLLHIKT